MFPGEKNPSVDRITYELRSTGLKPDQMAPLRSGTHTRGYLPHVKREGARYFVTFRLADSLPQEVVVKIQQERADRLTALHARRQTPQQRSHENLQMELGNI